jgi:hypothetical protein
MSTYDNYPRDLVGYGRTPPHPQWPGQARVALQFVLNYEEGARTMCCTAMRIRRPFSPKS